MLVTPAVPYLSIGLAGCSVDLEISHGADKQAGHPKVIKKKEEEGVFNSNISI